MLIKNSVTKNSIWIIACRIVQSILGVIVSMLTARYLGPSNYGLVNYAASIVAFLLPLMQLGLNAIIVQEIVNNKTKEGEVLGTTLVLSQISAVFCVISVFLFSLIANRGEKETIIVCCLFSIVLFFQGIEMIQYWFQAKLLSKYVSLTMLGSFVCVSAYRIFLLVSGKSVYWFAIANSIDFAIIAIVLIVIYRKKSSQKLTFSIVTAKKLLSKSKYYILSGMMVTIFSQTARIVLKLMADNDAVGYYSAAVACASMTAFVFAAIIDSARPVIFQSKETNPIVFEKNMSRLYSIIIYLSIFQSLFISVFAKLIIHILFGSQYYASITALRIIAWYTIFAYLGAVRDIWILAEGKHKILWVLNLTGAVLNIILNIIFIPLWGINGAAIVALITQIFTNVILGFFIKTIRHNNILMFNGLKIINIIELIKKK